MTVVAIEVSAQRMWIATATLTSFQFLGPANSLGSKTRTAPAHSIRTAHDVSSEVYAHSVLAGDFDGDNDTDLLSASSDGTITWYESNARDQRLHGDADGDGEVAFSDFLQLSSNFRQARQTPLWADGDFNQDGRVNFSDFLILSQHYGDVIATLMCADFA